MKLNEVSSMGNAKAFRKGRGHGTGNGKTSGRGHKGQNSRSGGGVRPGGIRRSLDFPPVARG